MAKQKHVADILQKVACVVIACPGKQFVLLFLLSRFALSCTVISHTNYTINCNVIVLRRPKPRLQSLLFKLKCRHIGRLWLQHQHLSLLPRSLLLTKPMVCARRLNFRPCHQQSKHQIFHMAKSFSFQHHCQRKIIFLL